jgi:hypothetical protein
MTDQSSPVLRRRSLRPVLLASGIVTAVGLAALAAAALWLRLPVTEGTGVDFGPMLLGAAGVLVAVCGFVMLFVGGVAVALDSRR